MPDPENSEGDGDYHLPREKIGSGTELGYKIGHFQSGSGIILSAYVDNQTGKEIQLQFTLTNGSGQILPPYTSTGFTTGTGEVTIPDLSAGDYTWQVKTIGTGLTDSVEVSRALDASNPDFAIFYGFEPYPYGYKFANTSPLGSLLNGGITGTGSNRMILPGRKWDIFLSAFSKVDYGSEKEMYDAFEMAGLTSENPWVFGGGNCFGMVYSAISLFNDSIVFSNKYTNFLGLINNRNLWNSIKIKTENDNPNDPGRWIEYGSPLETILSNQLVQYSSNYQLFLNQSKGRQSALEVASTIKNNPQNAYALSFWGYNTVLTGGKDCKFNTGLGNFFCREYHGHVVTPYKVVELNENNKKVTRIYFWDNNVQYPERVVNRLHQYSYNQYLEIDDNGHWSVNKDIYSWDGVTDLALVSSKQIDGYGIGLPMGFDKDTLLSFSGASEVSITDSQGNITGWKDGGIYEQIPGAEIITGLNSTLSSNTQDSWKQIYFKNQQGNLKITVEGSKIEKYTLFVAGGDYYTKIENVEVSTGSMDDFDINKSSIQIDFDNSKSGKFNILTDNFLLPQAKTVYIDDIIAIPNLQRYDINWANISNTVSNSVDLDNDGSFDLQSNINPSLGLGNISGYLTGIGKISLSGWKICIDLNGNGICEENSEPFSITDDKGYYKFSGIQQGKYNVMIVARQNWAVQEPVSQNYSFILNKGQEVNNLNFLIKKLNGQSK